jgi:hypothetical protein
MISLKPSAALAVQEVGRGLTVLAVANLGSCHVKPGFDRSSGATESFYSHLEGSIVIVCATEAWTIRVPSLVLGKEGRA